MAPVRILFTVDEHLPRLQIGQILRHHTVQAMDTGTKDPAILKAAEADGAIIVTSDHWIYDQLRRISHFDKGTYKRAGVVRIPGAWATAGPLLQRWLPVIEAVHKVTRGEADERVVIHIRDNGVVYIDP